MSILNDSHGVDSGRTDRVENKNPSYWNLPHRGQILILVICRVCEPLAYASITPYIYFMVRDFGYKEPSTIALLVTILTTVFSLGQALTAVWWGAFSDRRGRKISILLGLLGTAISIVIFGTSRNIYVALLGRFLAGILNGNVGVMRTVIAELIGDRKEFQTRAFAILPITMNVGVILGPAVGGILANPAEAYPSWFGNSHFLKKYPYILPNLFPLPVIVVALVICTLYFRETLDSPTAVLPADADPGLKLGTKLSQWLRRRSSDTTGYVGLQDEPNDASTVPLGHFESPPVTSTSLGPETSDSYHADVYAARAKQQLKEQARIDAYKLKLAQMSTTRKFKMILTRPVIVTLSTYVLLMFHAPTFMYLVPLFLSTPRIEESQPRTWLRFNGGLELPISTIGFIGSSLGVFGVCLQLLVYPQLAAYVGNARLHRRLLIVFPVCYFLIPYLSFLPSKPQYFSVIGTLPLAALGVIGRAFCNPPLVVLLTNASPNKLLMGTVHGLAHSITSIARMLGPFLVGNLYSLGIKWDMIELAWWFMAAIAILEIFVALHLKEWGVEELVEFDEASLMAELGISDEGELEHLEAVEELDDREELEELEELEEESGMLQDPFKTTRHN